MTTSKGWCECFKEETNNMLWNFCPSCGKSKPRPSEEDSLVEERCACCVCKKKKNKPEPSLREKLGKHICVNLDYVGYFPSLKAAQIAADFFLDTIKSMSCYKDCPCWSSDELRKAWEK